MSQLYDIHPINPQLHLIRLVAKCFIGGGIGIYPTDSAYALGCLMNNKSGIERIRQIRQLNKNHCLTLLCRDISELSHFAEVENVQFRFLKSMVPGPYTFILHATKAVSRFVMNTKQKTVGLRIANNKIVHALLNMLDEPLVSTSLILPGAQGALLEPDAMKDLLGKRVDVIINGGPCGIQPTSVIDLTKIPPQVIRQGKGDISAFILA